MIEFRLHKKRIYIGGEGTPLMSIHVENWPDTPDYLTPVQQIEYVRQKQGLFKYMEQEFGGLDNYKKPRSFYVSSLRSMDDNKLFEETKSKIWLSAFANNNPKSDYHWHAKACLYEWQRRNNPKGYDKAYNEVRSETLGE